MKGNAQCKLLLGIADDYAEDMARLRYGKAVEAAEDALELVDELLYIWEERLYLARSRAR